MGKSKRRKVGDDLRALLLTQTGYKCGNPNCRGIITLEIHHIIQVVDGGGNELENLLPLCPTCHALHHAGHIPQEAIIAWKTLLDSLNNPSRNLLDLLILLYKEPEHGKPRSGVTIGEINAPQDSGVPFIFSGDSLPLIAGPINSGLLEIYDRTHNVNVYGGASPNFKIRLTKKGNRLIGCWLSGDLASVNAIVGSTESAV